MKEDKYYMQEALLMAEKAYSMGEIPIGAVIVDENGEIISRAHNLREYNCDATAHAEVIAIRAAGKVKKGWRLKDCTLYVTVEPCPMCAGAAVMARLARIVYGVSDSKAGAVESIFNIPTHSSLNHNIVIRAGVLEEECGNILKKFFSECR